MQESKRLRQLLQAVRAGTLSVDEALDQLRDLPYETLEFARIDHHRALRKGFPEVVFGQGKTPEQVALLVERLAARGRVLATRVDPAQYEAVRQRVPQAVYHPEARALTVGDFPEPPEHPYGVVVSAGTADLPVAQEAALTARFMGARVETLFDVGVAGIHRVLDHRALLWEARAIVVVAGMEGALASVIGGLVACPVIAVPTSVGYGAHLGGLAPLLTMLNSCAPGVCVVNIDNGFGAGYCMALILQAP
ncbi:MAG: nickel pincer cofactor biosynthesis protein LarB [Armatimonadota bacterium]